MSLNQTACEGFLPLPQLCRGTLEQGYPTAPGAPFPVLLEVLKTAAFCSTCRYNPLTSSTPNKARRMNTALSFLPAS